MVVPGLVTDLACREDLIARSNYPKTLEEIDSEEEWQDREEEEHIVKVLSSHTVSGQRARRTGGFRIEFPKPIGFRKRPAESAFISDDNERRLRRRLERTSLVDKSPIAHRSPESRSDGSDSGGRDVPAIVGSFDCSVLGGPGPRRWLRDDLAVGSDGIGRGQEMGPSRGAGVDRGGRSSSPGFVPDRHY